ncbi:MAG: methyltransferase domain-containing protein [Desulfobacterales bacterium]|nr:methyltransferase domain-containing protein [Deltaproteobacteria bacterium]NNK93890.1 methyltransferase domain-containing protein [Desulfobacterales bacterium]
MTTPWDTGTLIGTSSAYWRGCALQAAVRLRIFSILGEEQKSLEEVRSALDADRRGTEYLLNALAAMRLINKHADFYQNSDEAVELLTESSGRYIGHIILHHHHLLDGWAQLDQAVRQGAPVAKRSYGEEVERESFLLGMFNLAMGSAPLVAAKVVLDGKKKLLDLGGGPGTFSIHFCRRNPDLQAVVFDRPTTKPFMQKTAAAFNLTDRINFIGGDFNRDPITGGPYDVAWLSHILHSNGPKQCQDLIEKTYDILEPGGEILIHDFILKDTKDSPEFGALFSLNMLINNPEGRSYSGAEIAVMLESAGFKDRRFIDPHTPNNSLIMSATR